MRVSQKKYRVIIFTLTMIAIFLAILISVTYFYINKTGKIPFAKENKTIISTSTKNSDTSPPINDNSIKTKIDSFIMKADELINPEQESLPKYIKVIDGCGPHFEGECLHVRSGPGTDYPIQAQLRNGIVLKVEDKVTIDGMSWYKIIFDEWLRYPERIHGDWYVAGDFVELLSDEGIKTLWDEDYVVPDKQDTGEKKIIVSRSEQKLYAYEGEEIFMEEKISTGLELTPTPRGTFKVFRKTPTRYMQGPLPNLIDQQYYDLPGVPWNLYFTDGGAVIHGAYWHNSFGRKYSHGCVNMPPESAQKLYGWAELGTKVIIKD